MATPHDLTITHIGGPTILLDFGGVRILEVNTIPVRLRCVSLPRSPAPASLNRGELIGFVLFFVDAGRERLLYP